MLTIPRLLLAAAGATAVVVPTIRDLDRGPIDRPDRQTQYTPQQVEYYLSNDEASWIRPGFNIAVESVDIDADQRVVVVVRFFDDLDQGLDMEGIHTPGPISASFILASYNEATREYEAYTTRDQTSPITGVTENQASTDRGGSWMDMDEGRYQYTFGTPLPAGYDMSRTHTVAIYANRDLRDLIEKRYIVNATQDFRPDGAAITATWAAADQATCNGCHTDLAIHGGQRKDVKLCATCHNSGSVDPDTGNTVDFKVMIHKIHAGEHLPSVQNGEPYQIIGFRQSVHDYSEVAFPQAINNCAACHSADVPQAFHAVTYPARHTCGACHDNIVWDTGEGHPIPQTDDSMCSTCHQPDSGREFDISVTGAHTIPEKSTQLAGLNVEILDLADAMPGTAPTITFSVTNDDDSLVDPATLDRMRFLVGGPTTDYASYFIENVENPTASGDAWMYTFSQPMPDDASGSWSFAPEFRRNVTIDDGSADGLELREVAFNTVYHASVTDNGAEPRREVVTNAKCNTCHDRLAFHGGGRINVQQCIICHNANQSDADDRPDEENPPASVHFKRMIHRIHTGEELTEDYTIYGFRSSVHNYNELLFPGLRQECQICHVSGSYEVPVPEGSLPTVTERDFYSPQAPNSAACLGCHDSEVAAAHAFTNTAPFSESCAACHGNDREFSVERVHAR